MPPSSHLTAPPRPLLALAPVPPPPHNHNHRYINSLTGQETTRVPPALAWARVTAADGSALWLNWASRVASAAATAPAELPAELAAELAMHPNRRWYNTATREYVYTDPAYATPWRELVDEGERRVRGIRRACVAWWQVGWLVGWRQVVGRWLAGGWRVVGRLVAGVGTHAIV